jgi:hypothetical protein
MWKKTFLERVVYSSLCLIAVLIAPAWGFLPLESLASLDSVVVRSLWQEVDVHKNVVLDGDVEVVVDGLGRVWADHVRIDSAAKTFVASSPETDFLSLETNDFLLFADHIECGLDPLLCDATNVRIQVGEKNLSAQHARKVGVGVWELEDVVFSGCDCPSPHWSITADRARITGSMLKIRSLYFRIGGWRVFGVPALFAPKPHHSDGEKSSNSGFMMPYASYDKHLGMGFDQAYYWAMSDRMDSTFGFRWYEHKGYALYNEFRRASGPEQYTILNSIFAREKHALQEQEGMVVNERVYRYWIDGFHFQKTMIKGIPIYHLIHLDFGTDKQIGYDFFTKPDSVEDWFHNTWIARHQNSKSYLEVLLDRQSLSREHFTFDEDITKEREDHYHRIRVPHATWHTAYQSLWDLCNYRHTIESDYVFFDWEKRCKFYEDQKVVDTSESMPLRSSNTFRFNYAGHFEKSIGLGGVTLFAKATPHVDVRSNTSDNSVVAKKGAWEVSLGSGAYRMYLEAEGGIVLPQVRVFDPCSSFYSLHQSQLYISYVPKFKQDHWFHADYLDRVFPKTRLGARCQSHFGCEDLYGDFNIDLAYECRDMDDIFPLDRARKTSHLLPLSTYGSVRSGEFGVASLCEWDLSDGRLIHSTIDFDYTTDWLHLHTGWVFYDDVVLGRRGLFEDVPSFGFLGVGVDVWRGLRVTYENELHATDPGILSIVTSGRLIAQRLSFLYTGHCFSFGFGVEDKRYRQQGVVKSEQSYFFSISLEGIGGLFKRFRMDPQKILSRNSV